MHVLVVYVRYLEKGCLWWYLSLSLSLSPAAVIRNIGICHISAYVDIYRYIVWKHHAQRLVPTDRHSLLLVNKHSSWRRRYHGPARTRS